MGDKFALEKDATPRRQLLVFCDEKRSEDDPSDGGVLYEAFQAHRQHKQQVVDVAFIHVEREHAVVPGIFGIVYQQTFLRLQLHSARIERTFNVRGQLH